MSKEQLIAEAILQLKQESSVIKDYIFPIAMALFSSLIGAIVGYRVYLRQEKLTTERGKLDILNKWILIADEIHQSLLALKFNYHGSLTSHPYQRFLAIPSIIGTNKKYQFNYYELAFITDFKSKNKWLNVGYLRSLFANYETLLSMWEIRNEFNEKVRIQFLNSKSGNKAYVDLDDAEIELYINQGDLSFLIDITERCLLLTDDLITEFYNFFNEFPHAVAHKVDLNLIKTYGFIIAFDMEKNKAIKPLLVDSPLPDYKKISELSGRSIEELMARYSSLFK
jgi:hypothetical protein